VTSIPRFTAHKCIAYGRRRLQYLLAIDLRRLHYDGRPSLSVLSSTQESQLQKYGYLLTVKDASACDNTRQLRMLYRPRPFIQRTGKPTWRRTHAVPLRTNGAS